MKDIYIDTDYKTCYLKGMSFDPKSTNHLFYRLGLGFTHPPPNVQRKILGVSADVHN